MDEQKKICVVTLDLESYVMALTKNQIKLLKWIGNKGYEISVEEQSEIIEF